MSSRGGRAQRGEEADLEFWTVSAARDAVTRQNSADALDRLVVVLSLDPAVELLERVGVRGLPAGEWHRAKRRPQDLLLDVVHERVTSP